MSKKTFYNVAILLDELSTKKDITLSDYSNLKSLLSKTELRIYFYRNLSNHTWFDILNETNEFYDILNQDSKENSVFILQIAVSEYLQKIAPSNSDQIVELIKRVIPNNSSVVWNFVQVGLKLDPKQTSKLVAEVKKWLSDPNLSSTVFDSEIIKWIQYLSSGNQLDAAFRLLKILTTPKIQKPSKVRDKKVEKIIGKDRSKPIPAIEYYYLQQLLSEGLSELIERDPLKLSRILQSSLEKSIRIEYGHIKGGFDLSYIWRAAIEEHPQNYEHYELNDALLVALRNSTEELVKRDTASGMVFIKEYLKHKYSIFRRLAIHLLRLNYENYSNIIKQFIKNKKLLKETDISHEYYILLRDIFEKLELSERKFIIDSIREIKSYDRKAKTEIQQKQIRYHHLGKLHFFEKYLDADDKIYYDQLKQEFEGEKIRDTAVYHESYTGERSPLTLEEINKKDLVELWDYFRSFRKTRKDFDAPSPEGLARIFAAAVKKNPHKYLKEDLTPLTLLKPNYSYWFMNDVNELYKSEKYPELVSYIENLLDFINRIIRIENIPKRFTDDMGINFNGVKRRSLDFVQSLIKTQQKESTAKYQDKIWEIIDYLCYFEWDPEKSIENSKTNMDPYTLAINSVRGNAIIAVIDYALWYASLTKGNYSTDIKNPNRLIGEERIQKLLDDKLTNKQDDPSLAIHSVFGVYLANLAYLNYEWVKANIDKIFPKEKDKEVYWSTAWGGYINASRFSTDLYRLLKTNFEKAIGYLSRGDKMIPSGFGRSPEDALSEHLVVACLNGKDDIRKSNSLLRKFAEIPNNPSITHAIQFVTNLFKEFPDEKRKSFWPQTKELWKIRINVVNNELKKKKRSDKEDEYDREFSRYISWLNNLPKNITLKELELLLLETIKINQRGWQLPNFIEYLSQNSVEYPLIAINLFEKLMNTKAPSYFFQGKEKEIENILENAINTEKSEAYYYADQIINKFGEWGNYYFKEFWKKNLEGRKIVKPKTPKFKKK